LKFIVDVSLSIVGFKRETDAARFFSFLPNAQRFLRRWTFDEGGPLPPTSFSKPRRRRITPMKPAHRIPQLFRRCFSFLFFSFFIF
jgi:hypothetical protein